MLIQGGHYFEVGRLIEEIQYVKVSLCFQAYIGEIERKTMHYDFSNLDENESQNQEFPSS